MRAQEFVSEKWSAKYKRSINCANPKGFSQRAHCAGRKKNESTADDHTANTIADELRKELDDYAQAQQGQTHKHHLASLEHSIRSLIDDLFDLGYTLDSNSGQLKKLTEQELEEQLYFKGSPCTVDCSGHRAGYEWWFRKRKVPNSWSQSFNNGAAIAAAGK